MNNKNLLYICLTVALLVSATVLTAYAGSNDAGGPEFRLLGALLTGAIGKTVGILVAFVGTYIALVKGEGLFGGILIVLGVLIAFTPALFTGVRSITCPLVEKITGESSGCRSIDFISQ